MGLKYFRSRDSHGFTVSPSYLQNIGWSEMDSISTIFSFLCPKEVGVCLHLAMWLIAVQTHCLVWLHLFSSESGPGKEDARPDRRKQGIWGHCRWKKLKIKIKSKKFFKESCLPKWMHLKSFEIRLIAKKLQLFPSQEETASTWGMKPSGTMKPDKLRSPTSLAGRSCSDS